MLLANVKAASDAAAEERTAAEMAHREVRALQEELRFKMSQIEEARRAVLSEAREQAREELEQIRAELRQWRGRVAATATEPVKEMLQVLDRLEDRIEPVEPAGAPLAPEDVGPPEGVIGCGCLPRVRRAYCKRSRATARWSLGGFRLRQLTGCGSRPLAGGGSPAGHEAVCAAR